MITIKTGDSVKMSDSLKEQLRNNDSKEHVEEFGDCIGTVEDLVFPDEECIESEETDYLYNVRWHPSELRYGYDLRTLELA